MPEEIKRILVVDDKGPRNYKPADMENGLRLMGINAEVCVVESAVHALDQLHLWHSQGYKANIISYDYIRPSGLEDHFMDMELGSVDSDKVYEYLHRYTRSSKVSMGHVLLGKLLDFLENEFGPEFLPDHYFVHSADNGVSLRVREQEVETICWFELSDMQVKIGDERYHDWWRNAETSKLIKTVNKEWGTNFPTSIEECNALRDSMDLTSQKDFHASVTTPKSAILTLEQATEAVNNRTLTEEGVLNSRIKIPEFNTLQYTELEDYPNVPELFCPEDGTLGAVCGRLALSEADVKWLEENHPEDSIVLIVEQAKDIDHLLGRIHGLGVLQNDHRAKHIKIVCENYDIPMIMGSEYPSEYEGKTYPLLENESISQYAGGDVWTANARDYVALEAKMHTDMFTGEQSLTAGVYHGQHAVASHPFPEALDRIIDVYDGARIRAGIKVSANADTVEQVLKAIVEGADSIGLVRSEKWLRNEEVHNQIVSLLLSGGKVDSYERLSLLHEHYKSNFSALMDAVSKANTDIFDITFRAPDYVPNETMDKEQRELFFERVGEKNSRGIKAAIRTSGLYEVFLSAFYEAIEETSFPIERAKLLAPMVSDVEEIKYFQELNSHFGGAQIADMGSMNEIPNFVENAADIASYVSFTRVGSNHLTNELMGGVERNDVSATESWMIANEQTGKDPFTSLCELAQEHILSSEQAISSTDENIKSSICGQQVGADKKSIEFAITNGLDISVSPKYLRYARLVAGATACKIEKQPAIDVSLDASVDETSRFDI